MAPSEGLIMDAKVKQARAVDKKHAGASYLQELKDELKKVSWTTKAELKSFTKITVGTIFFFGIGIYLMDLILKGALVGLGKFFQLIFG